MKIWDNADCNDKILFESMNKLFYNHKYLFNYLFEVDKPRIKHEPLDMIKQIKGFSDGEQVLIRVALDIWSGSGNAKVWQLLENLDQSNFNNTLHALLIASRVRF